MGKLTERDGVLKDIKEKIKLFGSKTADFEVCLLHVKSVLRQHLRRQELRRLARYNAMNHAVLNVPTDVDAIKEEDDGGPVVVPRAF